jgi:hypothetical protein
MRTTGEQRRRTTGEQHENNMRTTHEKKENEKQMHQYNQVKYKKVNIPPKKLYPINIDREVT